MIADRAPTKMVATMFGVGERAVQLWVKAEQQDLLSGFYADAHKESRAQLIMSAIPAAGERYRAYGHALAANVKRDRKRKARV